MRTDNTRLDDIYGAEVARAVTYRLVDWILPQFVKYRSVFMGNCFLIKSGMNTG